MTSFDNRKLAAARLAAAEAQPFLAEALYAMSPVAAPHLDTFSIDEKWRLFVGTAALDRWSVPEVAGVLLHEVGHLLRDHAGRANALGVHSANERRWNWAGDAEINQDLLADDVVLPDDPVTPQALGFEPGKVAEYYYRRLLDTRSRDLPDLSCGSGCHGVTGDGGNQLPTPPAETPGLNDGERVLLRRRVALTVQAATRTAAAGRLAGSGIGGWSRWAEAVLDPVIDWRPLIRGALRSAIGEVAGMVDYSYRRPSRRQIPGVLLPSMAQPLPSVASIIDTSASMSRLYLNAAWTEVQEAIRSVGIQRELVSVFMNDVAVEKIAQPFGNRVELSGGGGTDLRNGFAAAMKLRPKPGVLVVLTDGYTPWPDRPPPCKVVVGLLSDDDNDADDGSQPYIPPWATTIRIKVDPDAEV